MSRSRHFNPVISIVGFHHAKGPEVEHWIGLEEGNDTPEWPLLPFLALADGAHSSEEDFSYFTLKHTTPTSLTSLFGISCTRQLDSSELIDRPADVTRSTVQKAVVVIADTPTFFFGHLKQQLSAVTTAWFAQRNFEDLDIIRKFQESLKSNLRDKDGGRDQYVGLSLREFVYEFKHQTLVLFKCALLQPKMLFFGSRCERLCMIQFSLLSLVPGLLRCLQDCSDPDLNDYESTLSKPTSVKTSDRKSLLAFMGLPLQIFGKGSLFGPYTPLQQLDMLADVGTTSYIVGSTNSLLLQQKDRYSDILINLDECTVNITSPSLRTALSLSAADRRWIDSLVAAVVESWDEADPSRPKTMGYVGSEDYIRLQFEEYILSMLSSVKYHLFLEKHAGSASSEQNLFLPDVEGDPAEDFQMDWVDHWKRTENFRIFQKFTDSELFDIVPPRHVMAGSLTIEDVQRRVAQQIQELRLDEKVNQGREVVAKTLASGRSNVSIVFTNFTERFREQRRSQDQTRAPATPQSGPETSASEKMPAATPSPSMASPALTEASTGKGSYFSSWAAWAGEKRKKAFGGGTTPASSPPPEPTKASSDTSSEHGKDRPLPPLPSDSAKNSFEQSLRDSRNMHSDSTRSSPRRQSVSSSVAPSIVIKEPEEEKQVSLSIHNSSDSKPQPSIPIVNEEDEEVPPIPKNSVAAKPEQTKPIPLLPVVHKEAKLEEMKVTPPVPEKILTILSKSPESIETEEEEKTSTQLETPITAVPAAQEDIDEKKVALGIEERPSEVSLHQKIQSPVAKEPTSEMLNEFQDAKVEGEEAICITAAHVTALQIPQAAVEVKDELEVATPESPTLGSPLGCHGIAKEKEDVPENLSLAPPQHSEKPVKEEEQDDEKELPLALKKSVPASPIKSKVVGVEGKDEVPSPAEESIPAVSKVPQPIEDEKYVAPAPESQSSTTPEITQKIHGREIKYDEKKEVEQPVPESPTEASSELPEGVSPLQFCKPVLEPVSTGSGPEASPMVKFEKKQTLETPISLIQEISKEIEEEKVKSSASPEKLTPTPAIPEAIRETVEPEKDDIFPISKKSVIDFPAALEDLNSDESEVVGKPASPALTGVPRRFTLEENSEDEELEEPEKSDAPAAISIPEEFTSPAQVASPIKFAPEETKAEEFETPEKPVISVETALLPLSTSTPIDGPSEDIGSEKVETPDILAPPVQAVSRVLSPPGTLDTDKLEASGTPVSPIEISSPQTASSVQIASPEQAASLVRITPRGGEGEKVEGPGSPLQIKSPAQAATPVQFSSPVRSVEMGPPIQPDSTVRASTPAQVTSPVRGTSPTPASSPVKFDYPVRAIPPVQMHSPIQSSSPARSVSSMQVRSPVRSASPARVSSPVRSASPMRSISPLQVRSPVRSDSPVQAARRISQETEPTKVESPEKPDSPLESTSTDKPPTPVSPARKFSRDIKSDKLDLSRKASSALDFSSRRSMSPVQTTSEGPRSADKEETSAVPEASLSKFSRLRNEFKSDAGEKEKTPIMRKLQLGAAKIPEAFQEKSKPTNSTTPEIKPGKLVGKLKIGETKPLEKPKVEPAKKPLESRLKRFSIPKGDAPAETGSPLITKAGFGGSAASGSSSVPPVPKQPKEKRNSGEASPAAKSAFAARRAMFEKK